MDTETEKKIEETVLKILRNSDTMDKVTRDIIKKSSPENLWMNLSAPSESLGMKLSAPVYKEIVRQVVETYLTERKSNTEMKKVEETVVKFLRNSDVRDKVTEYIIWKSASENLGMNLSAAVYQEFVRQVVETYLTGDQSNTAAEAQQKEDEVEKQVEEEEDEEGGLIIARLSRMRKVTIAEFGGKPLLSIYEYSKWPGKEIPTSNGVSLTSEEWETCSMNVPTTEKAIRKMESRLARLDDLYKVNLRGQLDDLVHKVQASDMELQSGYPTLERSETSIMVLRGRGFVAMAVESRSTGLDGCIGSNDNKKMFRANLWTFMAGSGSCLVYKYLTRSLLLLHPPANVTSSQILAWTARESLGLIHSVVAILVNDYRDLLTRAGVKDIQQLVDARIKLLGVEIFLINESSILKLYLDPTSQCAWNHSIANVPDKVSFLGSGTPILEGYCHKKAAELNGIGSYDDGLIFVRDGIHEACLNDMRSGGKIHAVVVGDHFNHKVIWGQDDERLCINDYKEIENTWETIP